jgi:hypothetical protein
MRSLTRIVMAAALTLGLTGAAMADDRSDEGPRGDYRSRDGRSQDETWRDQQNNRDPGDWSGGRGTNDRGYVRRQGIDRRDTHGRDNVRGHAYNDRGYSRGYGRGYIRGYSLRGRGSVAPLERMRVRAARRHLRRVGWLAMRDGVVTRWERVRIHQARLRLAWLVQRAYSNDGSW